MLKIEHLKKHYDNFSLDCSLELIAMIGAFGGLAVITLVIVKGAEAIFNIDLVSLLDNLPTVSMGVLIAIAIIIALLMLLVSMKISLSIMNKKEF